MVNDIRRREDRIKSMVYGCVTDGQGFTFLRIDNDHKVNFPRFDLLYGANTFIYSTLYGTANGGITAFQRGTKYGLTWSV